MKKNGVIILLFLLNLIFSGFTIAQDTIIINNNYKYKIGAKFISEKSGDVGISNNTLQVFSGGIQISRKIKNSKFSIETGLYFINKANPYDYIDKNGTAHNIILPFYYHNLSVPLNIRYDTKLVYVSMGGFYDQLLYKSSKYPHYNDSIQPTFYATDRNFAIGVNVSLGIEKQIYKNWNLFVEARTSLNITSSKKEIKLIHEGYGNKGFAIGVNFKLPNKKS